MPKDEVTWLPHNSSYSGTKAHLEIHIHAHCPLLLTHSFVNDSKSRETSKKHFVKYDSGCPKPQYSDIESRHSGVY